MLRHLRLGLLALSLVVLCATSQLRAADLNKLLPDSTESVMSINVRQILDSAIVQKYGKDKLKDFIENQSEIKDYLTDLGLDPMKDVDSITVGTSGSGDKEKGLIVITGRFNQSKIEAKADELAKDKPDLIKPVKEGGYKFFEISPPKQPQSVYAMVVNKNLVLAASSKEVLVEALDKENGKRTSKLKNKELQDTVAKMDAKQSVWVVVPAEVLKQQLHNNEQAKFLDGIDLITGGITITDKIVFKASISAKDADAAKSLHTKIKQTLAGIQLLLAGQDQLAPVADVLNTVKTTVNDKAVSIQAEVGPEAIEKLHKLADQ